MSAITNNYFHPKYCIPLLAFKTNILFFCILKEPQKHLLLPSSAMPQLQLCWLSVALLSLLNEYSLHSASNNPLKMEKKNFNFVNG
jgi:hypothetical protein